jgi:hypothetical protein
MGTDSVRYSRGWCSSGSRSPGRPRPGENLNLALYNLFAIRDWIKPAAHKRVAAQQAAYGHHGSA